MTTQRHSAASAAILAALFTGVAFAQCPNTAIPGKFYEYYIVARTGSCNGNTFTVLGSGPAINDLAQVAFVGQTSTQAGNALWVGDGHNNPAANPINPGEIGSSEIYDSAVQLSTSLSAVQLVSQDSITDTSPATTSIRVWNVAQPDTYRYAARGGPHQQFAAVFGFPSVNANGDTAFIAASSANPLKKYLVEVTAAGTLTKVGVNVDVGQPMIDDNGDIVLYQTTTSGFEIMLFQNGLIDKTVIASQAKFSSLDSAPGISRDGMVIAFQGDLAAAGAKAPGTYPGPGIFAATNEGTATWHITRLTGLMVETLGTGNGNGICDPGEQCEPGAELGYDAMGNAIYFDSAGYAAGTRVAVTNLGLGAAGIDDDTFVVSFVGTPTEASRNNPVLNNGTPLFFSSQQGLWTIRVDVLHDLSKITVRVYHPRTAIPVVQINDRIGGNTVTALGVFDDVANAAEDESSNIRTMRRGDHRVAFWASISGGGQMIVRANHLDSDQDGLLDHWETTGIDMDQDGVVDLNLAQMGANVNARDLFLDIDWVTPPDGVAYTFQPAPGVINAVPDQAGLPPLQNMFNNAPPLSGNEYGARIDGADPDPIPAGIALHVDGGASDSNNMGAGPYGGGHSVGLTGTSSAGYPEVIYFGLPGDVTVPNESTRAFQDIKDNLFGLNDKDGRELAFHYVVFGAYIGAYNVGSTYSWSVATDTVNTLTSASTLPELPLDTNTHKRGEGDIVKITSGTGAGQYSTIDHVVNANKLQLKSVWNTLPAAGSAFIILEGYSGTSEEMVYPAPDYNSLPGNDSLIAMGAFAAPLNSQTTGSLGELCDQWRTLAHELGHTLGLRHGGIDNDEYKGGAYKSLMSYSWQQDCDGVSPVQSYSVLGDTTFNDWASLQHNFPDSEMHLGNTIGLGFGGAPEPTQTTPELSATDYYNQNGPIDTIPPALTIESPAAGSNVGLTLPLTVTVNATDNVLVAAVSVAFDVNGNGNTTDPGELVQATLTGTNTYQASFAALSGPVGTRTITASAIDTTGNPATTQAAVHVVQPNLVPSLASLSPTQATHGGAAFTLTINGSNFVAGSVAQWNGAPRATAFVNAGKLTVQILAGDIATAGTASVTVSNPAPGGGVSNALTFTID
jgi:Big-like domain-containing protein